MNAFLFVVLSGARIADGGARFSLESELVIGRGDKRTRNGNVLNVADGRMSGAHAKVARDAEGWFVEDLGSTNGTGVNGIGVKRATLADGDVIECGQTLFVFREIIGEKAGDLGSLDIDRPDGFATLDPALAKKLARLERVAASNLSVLLIGETGTGKEVLARGVHKLSGRPGPFVAVNCGAIPANLVESHLFGHTKGAFSGALRDELGHVRAGNFGTLLLDEIGDLPANAQAALLRVLQEGEVVPVGSTTPMKVDVRVIGATHKPLEELVAAGAFRQDLYARLAGYVFPVPPLRERMVDLGLLVATLAERGKIEHELRVHRDAGRALIRYAWPMNVRELEQCLKASGVLAEDGIVMLKDLPPAIAVAKEAEEDQSDDDDELRRTLIAKLVATNGNVSEVAREMAKARQQVQRWLKRLAIDADVYKKR